MHASVKSEKVLAMCCEKENRGKTIYIFPNAGVNTMIPVFLVDENNPWIFSIVILLGIKNVYLRV